MRHLTSWRSFGLIIGLVVLLGVPGLLWRSHQVAVVRATYKSPVAPVILVPGSSATQNRFNALVKELNGQTKTQHSLLRVEVKTNGHLVYNGAIRHGDKRPFIVIGFQNHHDGAVNIRKQARWFAIAFRALQRTYHFNHFSAMGHSNGGLVLTLFLENDLAATGATADRLMTIAASFNLEQASATVETPLFKQLVAGRDRLATSLIVYSIAGSKSYTGDGIVPFASVNRGKYIFQKRVRSFTQIIVSGANANHAHLPENRQIVRLIRQDLLV